MDTTETGSHRHMLQIIRKTRMDTLCKLTYRLTLGQSDRGPGRFYRTDLRQEIFDFNGDGESLYFSDDYLRFVNEKTNQMKLSLELISLTYINQVKLSVANVLNGGVPENNKSPLVQFADKDRQNWCVVLNQKIGESEYVNLTLLYPDLPNIPRNYLRYVCWSLHVLPKSVTPNVKIQPPGGATASGAPFECYYAQLEQDRGFSVRTQLKTNELKTPGNLWLDEKDGRITLEIEWLCSYLLLHPCYHPYDDIYRKHIAQMRREVQALQAENNSLEKELHNYQMSIANKGAGVGGPQRGTPPPRTWSSDSAANMANSVEKCNLEDGRSSSSSSHMVSPCRPTADATSARSTPTPRSPIPPYANSPNIDSQVHYHLQQSPVRKRLPTPQKHNFKLDPIACPTESGDDVIAHGDASISDSMQINRRQSTPIVQSSTLSTEATDFFAAGQLDQQRLTRRVSERHTKSDRNLSFRNKHVIEKTQPMADRSKSVSPFPLDNDNGAVYDSARAFAYDNDQRQQQSTVCSDNTKHANTAFLQQRSNRRGRNAGGIGGGGSFRNRTESWTFHYNNIA